MPTSEAQKLANKRWRENNREHWRELCNKGKKTYFEKHPEAVERGRQISREYYWKNRERILEEKRLLYVPRNTKTNDLEKMYHDACGPDEPLTDSEDLNSVGSDISNLTDWETVADTVSAVPETVAVPPPQMTPEPLNKPAKILCFTHPLFMK